MFSGSSDNNPRNDSVQKLVAIFGRNQHNTDQTSELGDRYGNSHSDDLNKPSFRRLLGQQRSPWS